MISFSKQTILDKWLKIKDNTNKNLKKEKDPIFIRIEVTLNKKTIISFKIQVKIE